MCQSGIQKIHIGYSGGVFADRPIGGGHVLPINGILVGSHRHDQFRAVAGGRFGHLRKRIGNGVDLLLGQEALPAVVGGGCVIEQKPVLTHDHLIASRVEDVFHHRAVLIDEKLAGGEMIGEPGIKFIEEIGIELALRRKGRKRCQIPPLRIRIHRDKECTQAKDQAQRDKHAAI